MLIWHMTGTRSAAAGPWPRAFFLWAHRRIVPSARSTSMPGFPFLYSLFMEEDEIGGLRAIPPSRHFRLLYTPTTFPIDILGLSELILFHAERRTHEKE